MWLCHPRRGSWDCLWPQLTKLHWNHPWAWCPFQKVGEPEREWMLPSTPSSASLCQWCAGVVGNLFGISCPMPVLPFGGFQSESNVAFPLPLLSPPQEGGVTARGSSGHPGRRGLGHAAGRGNRLPQRGARSRARPRSAAAPPRWSRSRGPVCAAWRRGAPSQPPLPLPASRWGLRDSFGHSPPPVYVSRRPDSVIKPRRGSAATRAARSAAVAGR